MCKYLKDNGISQEHYGKYYSHYVTRQSDYRFFKIPKSSGKLRTIEEPLEPLKTIQRTINGLLSQYPFHQAAYGLGGQGKGAIDNAKYHDGKIIVKMDIEKFFPNTTRKKFRKGLACCSADFRQQIKEMELFCFVEANKKLRIATGAPTSPLISSIAFTPADHELAKLAQKYSLKYTRYIDDLTFSGLSYPQGFQKEVNLIVRKHGYKLNHEKSELLYSDNNTQIITGVCVNKKPNISRQYKRNLRAELNCLAMKADKLDQSSEGKINYIRQLNPKQAQSLREYFKRRVEFWRHNA